MRNKAAKHTSRRGKNTFPIPRLKNYVDFLWEMTQREIKVQYKHAMLGFLWIILNPLFQMLLIWFIFSLFISIPVNNYPLFLFVGLLAWQFFSFSVSSATTAFVRDRYLVQKTKFPLEVIPLSITLSNFFNFIIALLLLIVFLIIAGSLPFPNILLLLPASLALLTLTSGSALLMASLQVKYRDTKFFVQSLLMLWFYATPIIYNLEVIPPSIKVLFFLNPLTTIFELFHLSLTTSGATLGSYLVAANAALTVLIVGSGIRVFQKEKRYFSDWL